MYILSRLSSILTPPPLPPTSFQGMVGELDLESLDRKDAGNYTCRVEFYKSPTMMTLLTLDVHGEGMMGGICVVTVF